jgi:hypothetical protein
MPSRTKRKRVGKSKRRGKKKVWLERFASCPHPRLFFAKSAESLEKKRVEFLLSAKKCKRVCKDMKIKEIDWKRVDDAPLPPMFL